MVLRLILLAIIIVATIASVWAVIIYFSIKQSEHPISCPNCGKFFRLNYKKLIPANLIRNFDEDHRILRCPYCNKKDICKIHFDKD